MADLRHQIYDWLLEADPVYTLAEAAERTGVDAELILRLWRALGFANPPEGEPVFTDHDLVAFSGMTAAADPSVIDEDTEVRLARAIGQMVARLADWQVNVMLARTDDLVDAGGTVSDTQSVGLQVADTVGPAYEQVLLFAWKRHLIAAINRALAVGDAVDTPEVVRTVGFADIVSFSELSNRLSDDRIGELVEKFETRATDVVNGLGGRVVKTLGDSVLFECESPSVGIEIAHGIISVIGADSRLPDVRLGVATGTVVHRFGDVFGPPVNYAARLTTIARRNRIITDETTAAALPGNRYETRALTARPIRGFGVREPIAVRRL